MTSCPLEESVEVVDMLVSYPSYLTRQASTRCSASRARRATSELRRGAGSGGLTVKPQDDILNVMREVTAVQLRQGLGKVARSLRRDREPILLKLGQRPVGVIVTVEDFRERFALDAAASERQALVAEIVAERKRGRTSVERALAGLRKR